MNHARGVSPEHFSIFFISDFRIADCGTRATICSKPGLKTGKWYKLAKHHTYCIQTSNIILTVFTKHHTNVAGGLLLMLAKNKFLFIL